MTAHGYFVFISPKHFGNSTRETLSVGRVTADLLQDKTGEVVERTG